MSAAAPEISKGRKFTAVWIIPVTAVVIGIWMVVWTYLSEGPEIEVEFETANGLEAGKTVVRYRNVQMGLVKEVRLSDDLKRVIAVIKMQREAIPLLKEDTRFWVVTARIGGGSVSGLETIITGAYIEVSPGLSENGARDFVGLEEPPLTPAGTPGLRLVLTSERSASITTGDPVLYHGFQVGRVESLSFDPDSRRIKNTIFIDAPYDTLVTSTTRFWDVSGISVSAGAEGFRVETGSLISILRGGVTFAIPPDFERGSPVEDNTEFRLFSNYDEILDSPHEYRAYFVVTFKQSVKGLLPGAPVVFRGIQMGEVERIMMKEMVDKSLRENLEGQGPPIPVLIYLEPARMALPDTGEMLEMAKTTITTGVENGLRASIQTGSLLTGAQIIDLDYYPDVPPAGIGEFEGYPVVPTIATGLGRLETSISTLLDKANNLPLEELVGSVNLAVTELNHTLKALRAVAEKDSTQRIPDELDGALAALRNLLESKDTNAIPVEARASLEALRKMLEGNDFRQIPGELNDTLAAAKFQLQGESPEVYQLNKTLKEVESAARALSEFLDTLEKKPESLIRGKSDTQQ